MGEIYNMKKDGNYLILIFICIIGFTLFMYPIIANYENSKYGLHIIDDYSKSVRNYSLEEARKIKNEVDEYNQDLLKRTYQFSLSDELKTKYNSLLDIDGNGNMGYLEIDAINVKLPIYHTVKDDVLDKSVGHIEWSSLPVGGESTHAVFSAHNGLVGPRLFTDLYKLKIGDKFIIHVLDERLVYEIDQIKTIEPDDTNDLKIIDGEDFVTLMTCTPYGINTHRLLVRGHRIIDNKEFSSFAPNGIIINKYVQAGLLSIVPLCLFMLILIISNKRASKKQNCEKQ